MNDFLQKNAILWFFDNWYFPYSATYQTYSKFSRECNGDIHFLLWAIHLKKIAKKPNNWAVFVWIQKSAPRKIYFLTDFIITHVCASPYDGIGKCHQSQTWRYQGATVRYSDVETQTKRVKIRVYLRICSLDFFRSCFQKFSLKENYFKTFFSC